MKDIETIVILALDDGTTNLAHHVPDMLVA